MLFVLLLSWLLTGLIIGFIASKVVNLHGDAPIGGIGVSALGGVVTGVAAMLIGGTGFTFAIVPFIAAAVGAVVAMVIWHLVRSKYVVRQHYTTRRSY